MDVNEWVREGGLLVEDGVQVKEVRVAVGVMDRVQEGLGLLLGLWVTELQVRVGVCEKDLGD